MRPAALLFCLLCLAACVSPVRQDALLTLGDIAAGTGPSRLKQSTPAPVRTTVGYRYDNKAHAADLYVPGEKQAVRAGVVLVPGAVPEGKDDARLVALAQTLARQHFAVLVPEMSGYRDLVIRPQHAGEVADAFRYLASREDLAPGGRAGIAAFSYAAGPAVLAALQDDLRDRVRFVLAVGGYYDLRNAIRFFTTGYFEDNGAPQRLAASEYGKLVFIHSARAQLRSARDRKLLSDIAETRLQDPGADVSALAGRLGREGASIYRLLANTDPARTADLLAELPPQTIATIDALSLNNKPLSRLKARLILVHGKDDALIPYTESVALSRAAPRGQADLFLIQRILGHVDLKMSSLFSGRFWSQELPDARRLWAAITRLLEQREPTELGKP
jgi:hypothetical protein